jgi:acetyl esterase/lipase
VIPWLFLGWSLVGVALAANVLWPRPAPSGLSIVSFFAGWLVGEMALHALAFQVLAAAVFIALGGAVGWPGLAALVLTGVGAVLLLAGHRLAMRAAVAVETAFHQGVPAAVEAEALPPSLGTWPLLVPFPVRHRAVVSRWHVPFHTVNGLTLRLDVHRAREPRPASAGPAPTLVYVHGGGWVLGFRERQGLPLMQHLAAHGWVCVSVDYRLSPRATFPDHLVDVKRALAWVRAHADELGADPGFVAIAGNSAGAHLAALAALTANDGAYQPGFEDVDTSVAACVGFYGVYDLLDRRAQWRHGGMKRLLARHVMKATRADAPAAYEAASPVSRVHPDAPPFLLVHGTHDTLAPVGESRHLFERLRAVSRAPSAYVEVPGAQHAFEVFPSVRTAHVVDGVARFLEGVRAAHATAQARHAAARAHTSEIVLATRSHAI